MNSDFGTFSTTEIYSPNLTDVSGTLSFTENGGAKAIDGDLSVTDADDTYLESATITISSGYVSSEDVLGFTTLRLRLSLLSE
ncbi:hypothetical protein OAH23_12455 [Verrucomicrobia bacterium]|nr:hypothetical protein [Verrucomicrobiota bacterium]MDB4691218.1 hypothetical protein [Verrucomicrobiota bacterium]